MVVVGVAYAQFITPAITTQNQNIYRSLGNLGQVSTYSKTIDTPFSSVSKADVRVSNPGLAIGHGIVSPLGHGLLSPLSQRLVSPLGHGLVSPLGSGLISPLGRGLVSPLNHGLVSPLGPRVAATGLLGVAYSAAPAVSHMTYTNGLGLNYAW